MVAYIVCIQNWEDGAPIIHAITTNKEKAEKCRQKLEKEIDNKLLYPTYVEEVVVDDEVYYVGEE